jgi:hypothetical protein
VPAVSVAEGPALATIEIVDGRHEALDLVPPKDRRGVQGRLPRGVVGQFEILQLTAKAARRVVCWCCKFSIQCGLDMFQSRNPVAPFILLICVCYMLCQISQHDSPSVW